MDDVNLQQGALKVEVSQSLAARDRDDVKARQFWKSQNVSGQKSKTEQLFVFNASSHSHITKLKGTTNKIIKQQKENKSTS